MARWGRISDAPIVKRRCQWLAASWQPRPKSASKAGSSRRCRLETLESRLALSSVTVVSHGAAPALVGNPLESLAEELYAHWDRQNPQHAGLLQYDPATGNLALTTGSRAAENKIVLFDWLAESDSIQAGFDEAAADALFAMLVDHQLLESDYLHLVGRHSTGRHLRGRSRPLKEGRTQESIQILLVSSLEYRQRV